MRTLVLPLSALLCALPSLFAQVQSIPGGHYSSDLYIPTILQNTIKVEKVRAGDEVRFESAEAVLLHDGLVIPKGAKLYGHVRQSEAVESSAESRLSIEIDRAEWRHNQTLLHAFISGVGLRRQVVNQPTNTRCRGYDPDAQVRSQGPTFPRQPDCSMGWLQNQTVVRDIDFKLEELRLRTNLRDGSTTLISAKKNIHLPGGLLVMLHNVPVKNQEPAVEAESR